MQEIYPCETGFRADDNEEVPISISRHYVLLSTVVDGNVLTELVWFFIGDCGQFVFAPFLVLPTETVVADWHQVDMSGEIAIFFDVTLL